MKQPYFITADGVAVKANDWVWCIGVLNTKVVYRDRCRIAIRTNSEENIFSNRAAAALRSVIKGMGYER